MSEHPTFDLHRFQALAGRELEAYVEPLLAAPTVEAPSLTFEQLAALLPVLDEQHLVYALELGMLMQPGAFIDRVFAFLTHQDSSVCCTAYRLLSRSRASAPADFRDKVAVVPTVDLFTAHPITAEKVRVGTNAEFVRSLVRDFA